MLRIGQRRQYVTAADLLQAASRPSSRIAPSDLDALIQQAVGESLLLQDLRTFFERKDGTFSQRWVYRVNSRHALGAELLAEQDL